MLSTSAVARRPTRAGSARTRFALTTDEATFKKLAGRFDLLIDTVSAPHDYNAYLGLLRPLGTMVLVGVPAEPAAGRRVLAHLGQQAPGRLAASAASPRPRRCSTSAAQHKIVSDIELIPIQKINEAYERMIKADVRYRFVIDNASLKQA